MLSVVCWKWRPAGHYRSTFTAEAVNVLQRMIARYYQRPHRFICVCDEPTGIDAAVEIVPLWSDYADVPSPHGAGQPSCYRRLKAFAPEIADVFGERFVSLDLDTVVVGDLAPIFDRPEDFVIWGETDPRSWYNGSLWLMTAGARRQVWDRFDPRTSPRAAKVAGKFGSDQGWISYVLGPGEATWSTKDGVYSFRVHLAPNAGRLPADARIVMFHGHHDPWGEYAQRLPWVREAYQ